MDVGSESDALHVFGSLWCSAISNILQKRKSLEDPPEPSDSWASYCGYVWLSSQLCKNLEENDDHGRHSCQFLCSQETNLYLSELEFRFKNVYRVST